MSYLSRPKRSGTPKAKSHRQERRLAQEFGGRTTPGSGSGSIKGDVTTDGEMIEAKTTSKTQFTLRLETLQKLTVEADAAGKRPVLVLQFDDDTPIYLTHSEWVVVPKRDYLALKEQP